MKKNKFLVAIGITVFTMVIAFNINLSLNSYNFPDIILANIEALAVTEQEFKEKTGCDVRFSEYDICKASSTGTQGCPRSYASGDCKSNTL